MERYPSLITLKALTFRNSTAELFSVVITNLNIGISHQKWISYYHYQEKPKGAKMRDDSEKEARPGREEDRIDDKVTKKQIYFQFISGKFDYSGVENKKKPFLFLMHKLY